MKDISAYNEEIQNNILIWRNKAVLRKIYKEFYHLIKANISSDINGHVVELGSGTGSLREVIPQCITTDIFPNSWIDVVENAYDLAFKPNSVSHIILFDVFHHLQFPGKALDSFQRLLCDKGRVIIVEPYISLLGFIVYGLFHQEPVQWRKPIQWEKRDPTQLKKGQYYAAQGNATRLFFSDAQYDKLMLGWKVVSKQRFTSLPYILSGGYSKRQLYPTALYPMLKKIDFILNCLPAVFSTRTLIVLEKT